MRLCIAFSSLSCLVASNSSVAKVVELLSQLKSKVLQDMAAEAKMSEEYFSWAEKTEWEKSRDVEDGERESAGLAAAVEEAAADIGANEAEIEKQAKSIAAIERDLQTATKIREKERATFGKEEEELMDASDALDRAQVVLNQHLSLLGNNELKGQMSMLATSLGKVIEGSWVNGRSREQMKALLQEGEDGFDFDNPTARAYTHQSGGILATLGKLQDEAEEALNNLRRTEVQMQHSYELLKQEIEDECKYRNRELEGAQGNKAAAEERRSESAKNQAIVARAWQDDREFLAGLKESWATREADHEASQQSFRDELAAIEEASRILTKEDFASALSRQGGSLVQLKSDQRRLYAATAQALRRLGMKYNSAELMQLAAQARADPFAKVRDMISDMIQTLERQAVEEAEHKAWCHTELKANAGKIANRKGKLDKYNERIEKYSADIEVLTKNVERLQQETADMDVAMAEASKLRGNQKNEFKTTKADCELALSSLQQAIQILRAYYQGGGAPPPALAQVPRTFAANQGASTGIIAMLEVAESDFTKLLAGSTAAEEEAQAAFTKFKNEYEVSQASKAAEIKGKTQEIKAKKNSRNDAEGDRANTQEELEAVLAYNAQVKEQCTYKVPTFEARAARRKDEIEGLKNALSILEGEQVASPPSSSASQEGQIAFPPSSSTSPGEANALLETRFRSVSAHFSF